MSYKIVSIPEEISRTARETLMSPQFKGMKADVSVATGYGPCRSCLNVFKQGEDERIYITYNSFDGIADLPDPGPIFIHKRECERYEEVGFPPNLQELPLLLEAFGDKSKLLGREKMNTENIDSQIEHAFTDMAVRFINLRNAEAGCFVARIERDSA